MATKRNRSAFEEQLTKQESPYAFYGTPLPPLDSQTRDDGSYVPVWQQEVRDERGRKRLHGAFTGGFSAGYFNTVGSKEGWTPQAFVSSRTNRAKAQQKPEDYMDEEDVAEAEAAKTLQAAAGFGGLGGEGGGVGNKLLDVMRPSAADSMGVQLLQKMGWRQGQGVGPKVRRKARADEDGEDAQDHFFAPENSSMIKFAKKSDFKGLGYAGELSLPRAIEDVKPEPEEEDDSTAAWSRDKFKAPKKKPKKIKPSFGVGILNDTGSDDEDPYQLGPKISYSRTIGGDKEHKKKPAVVKGANPLLASKPIFTSRKNPPSKPGFRKCHDGRLPLNGFVLAMQNLDLAQQTRYPPPSIPDDWHGKRSRWDVKPAEEFRSTSDIAKASTLDPKARAAALGEQALPGKSIFDFISPAACNKLATASGRSDLPQAKGEEAPAAFRQSDEEKRRQDWHAIPELAKSIAVEALQRGVGGWMPYADDLAKRARYRAFLELKAGIRPAGELPERVKGVSKEDWRSELSEFAQAAEVFRPITGTMASRFTSAKSSSALTGSDTRNTNDGELLTKPTEKPEDPAEAATKMGMYGPLTRSVLPFYPTKLLCKRFNVRPPENVAVDPGADPEGGKERREAKEMLPKKAIERMMRDVALKQFTTRVAASVNQHGSADVMPDVKMEGDVVVDAGRNQALEMERPGDAVFKAIFGSEDEDEDD